AVFLSYASQDTEAAQRLCDALRAGGIEVWFDQNELVGGDAWDAKIRKQIAECALFVPLISAATQARREGYFRLEWRIAAQRTHMMSESVAFLLPVVIDATRDAEADVPGEFKAVQWTRLPGGEGAEKFCARVNALLGGEAPVARVSRPVRVENTGQETRATPEPRRRVPAAAWIAAASVLIIAAVGASLWLRRPASGPAATSTAAPAPGAVAILPFSVARPLAADGELADSLHDEVITALTRIRDLRVLSREAVQAFRDPAQRKRETIARQLRAGAIVEIALLREGTGMKVDARMMNARTGAIEWSDDFRAETDAPGDRAALPGLLARKIATAAGVTPAGAEQIARARPPTRNAEAYAFYQQARLNYADAESRSVLKDEEKIKLLRAAVAKDPDFAAAYARLVEVHALMYWFASRDRSPARKSLAKEALDQAVRLAPDDPETQLARGIYLYRCERDFRRALEAFGAAEVVRPGDAELKRWMASTLRRMGRLKEAMTAAEAALVLEPRNQSLIELLMETCFQFRRFDAAVEYGQRFVEITSRRGNLRWLARSSYELSGDKAQYEREMFPGGAGGSGPTSLRVRYPAALFRGDFDEAARLLDDPQLWAELFLTPITPSLRSLESAPSVHRARLALLRGDREAAKVRANEALKRLAREVQPAEDGYIFRVAIAEMMAIAGGGEEAVVAMKKELADLARFDAFEALKHQHRLACVYAAAGMTREALDQLALLMQQPCDATPSELREEPMLASLRARPEFERILETARKL
ncbi:MAG: TIR domain-containing protein, partial [Verrucomicrobia bacterium]|nr:TIR domain-containing protein [Verrucomicrobiota bacterium]